MFAFEMPGLGRVFVTSADAKLLSVKLPAVSSPDLEKIAHTVFSFLPEFIPKTQFVDGLRTDAFPVGELKEWMIIAALFHKVAPTRALVENFGPQLLHVILAVRNNGPQALNTVANEYVDDQLAQYLVTMINQFSEGEFEEFWREKIDLQVFRRLEREERAGSTDLRQKSLRQG